MAAATQTRSSGMGLALAAGALVVIAAYGVGGVNVTPRPHAVEKHGEAVYGARAAMAQGPQRRRECPNSDRVINMTPLDNGQWAVLIEGLTSHVELTCWIVSAEDVERTWIRLLEMHHCPADAEQRAAGHDFFSEEVR